MSMRGTIAMAWIGWIVLTIASATAAWAQEKWFPADAVVDVTRPPYRAKPDDSVDDTVALQLAITQNVGTGRFLYFPTGIYDVSDTLVAKDVNGVWRARLVLHGAGRERVVLRLADGARGFDDPARPKAVVMTGSHWQTGDSPDGGGNKAFGNYLLDLTIDTGRGNRGAVGVEYAVSNFGSIRNVDVRGGDGQGVAGITMRRRIPGPGLIKDVRITGFDVGIDVADVQYGTTIENLAVTGQHVAGIRVSDNLLHVRQLKSENRVPAALVTGANGALTLLDSQLTRGGPENVAIDCAGSLMIRNLTTAGYRADAVRCRGNTMEGPKYQQWTRPAALGEELSDEAPAAALLTIEETPEFWNTDLADWVAVGPRQPGESDDTAAIQRAIDSGRGTIYFPNDRVYFLSDTVVVRRGVRQIIGMGAEISLGAAKEPFSDRANPRPLIRIDPTASPTVVLEHLFFNAQYPGEVIFENNSPATLVIRHCAGWVGADGHRRSYRNTAAATGKLFIEDVFLPGWSFAKQNVWARQFNPENFDGDGTAPQVSNSGGRLWILGFKTEGPAPFLSTTDGGISELLGAYNYISATHAAHVPVDAVPYLITDSTAALTFVTDNFRDSDYRVYIREAQAGRVQEWRGPDLHPRNGHPGDRSYAVTYFLGR